MSPAERWSGGGLVLALDTSTRWSLVVIGEAAPLAAPLAVSRLDVGHRHGSHLLAQVEEVLTAARTERTSIGAIAVGTGPGSFSGLRVGLALAKTMAYALDVPIVGLMSSAALRRAAAAAGTPDAVVVLPAGAHDRYVARPGEDPRLVPPGGLVDAVGGQPLLAVDVAVDLVGEAAIALGMRAIEDLPAALLALARERLESGAGDDVAELVPAYVALPRGVSRGAEELGWSPDLR